MLKTLLIEDELPCRNNLKGLLQQFCGDHIRVVGEAGAVNDAVALAFRKRPQLVFLDVQLMGGTGFDVLDQLKASTSFKTIMVTAYDQYAIKAIKYAALDYLLKPIDVSELQAAVERAVAGRPPGIQEPVITEQPSETETLAISSTEGTVLVPVSKIAWCEAEGSYSILRLEDGRQRLISKNLSAMQALLPEERFFRIHRSYIVNLTQMSKLGTEREGNVVLRTGTQLPVSRRRRKALRTQLQYFNA